MSQTLYCNFCGKSQHEVAYLVAGPTVFICDECVDLCAEICGQARADSRKKKHFNDVVRNGT